MQLSQTKSIRHTLATVTAALLGTAVSARAELNKFETSLLLYSEIDRVKTAEGVASFDLALKGERVLGLKLTLDGLTGASPTGATPSRRIQTITGASGGSVVSVPAGSIPRDESFSDSRYAVDASLTQPLSRITLASFGGHYSSERDYSSFGFNVGLTQDLFRKNTTIGISASVSHDLISAKGGVPIPLSATTVSAVGENNDQERGDEVEGGGDHELSGDTKNKNIFDAVASFAQIVDRYTLVRINYSLSHSSGYLNDPYKILSVVQDPGDVDPGEPLQNLYENRPGTRDKRALFGEVRRYLGGNTIDLSYRYFWDDWGITSNTVDVTYRQQLGRDRSLKPHLRWYRQTQADFYRQFLVNGQPLPDYASADYRLGAFYAYTLGLQYSFPVGEQMHMSLAGEYYMQRGKRGPPEAFGSLRNFVLFPDLDALMFRIGFTREF
ncbi:MAG: DUF3570 domain-containing protein [candidate division Zixibacteria bacterium]|nr:DUF3570 domain-containing protein [candidate division Zixibacteria bacterium]